MREETRSLLFGVFRKAVSIAIAAFLIVSLNFAAYNVLVSDPPSIFTEPFGTNSQYWEYAEDARLNDSLTVQYIDYIADTLRGDLRESWMTGKDIAGFIWNPVWHTLALFTVALLGSLVVGALLERLARGGKDRCRALAVHGLALALVFVPTLSIAIFLAKANVSWDLGLPLGGDGTVYYSDGDSLAYSVISSAVVPLLAAFLSSVPLAVIMFREGLARSGASGPVKGPWLARFASGLARLRPMAHFHVAWTMSIVLMVDMYFVYGGLGQEMRDSMYHRDPPLMMATTLIIPMMVLFLAAALSLALHIIAGKGVRGASGDWGRGDAAIASQAPRPAREGAAVGAWAVSIWRSFKSGRTSIASAAMLAALIALGALAPVLATVQDPADIPWGYGGHDRFPLPPSLERSSLTGLVHPLGTDLYGRDVYSMMLYANRYSALVMVALTALTIVIGYAVGMLVAATAPVKGLPARALDFVLTPFARAFVSFPLLVIVMMRLPFADDWNVIHLATIVGAFYAWAWLLIARPIRAAVASGEKARAGALAPTLLAESLSVAKFAVPLSMMTLFTLHAIGGGADPYDWGNILESWSDMIVLVDDCWRLVILPALGVLAICGTAFVFLDRAERAVRNVASYPRLG